MKRLIGMVVVIVVGIIAIFLLTGWIGLLDGTPPGDMYDRYVKGYGPADTPQEAADRLKKALKNRDFKNAARYFTSTYAEQLRRGHKSARAMTKKMDDLSYQMEQRGYHTDESKLLFVLLDPFPSDLSITIDKATSDDAVANIVLANLPKLRYEQSSGYWQLDSQMSNVFWQGVVNPRTLGFAVKVKKEKNGWKFDVPVPPVMQRSVERMNDKYKDYENAFKVLSMEVKNDPDVKENVRKRLKELIEEAAKS
jgi:hypothetical protein